jgi:phage/plasmid-like protein (TIGR03299 family)
MAHALEMNENGEAMMAYAGETPWHGLGKKVPNDLSPEQMLQTAGLDWTVEKHPTFFTKGNEQFQTEKYALVRSTDNSVLDVVSADWKPVQNQEAFEFFSEYVYAGDMEMHTAGSLREGQIVWALAKVKDSFELFGGDKVDSYLMFTNPHKWGQSIDIRFTPIRVVCNNTLTAALNTKSKNAVKVNHRSIFDPENVKTTLGIASEQLNLYKSQAQFLGKNRYKNDALKEYFKEIFPVLTQKENSKKEMSKTAQVAMSVVDVQPGAEFAKGSWWQAFNAVTFLVDHKIGRTQESRLASSWFGLNRNLKQKALLKAIEYAEVA